MPKQDGDFVDKSAAFEFEFRFYSFRGFILCINKCVLEGTLKRAQA